MRVSRFTKILFGVGLFHVVLMWLVGFNGLYGQDSYEYVRYAQAWKAYIIEGSAFPGDYFWPVGYPLIGALASIISFSSVAKVMVLLSLLSHLITANLIKSCLHKVSPSNPALVDAFVLMGFVFSPLLLLSGSLGMSDSLSLLFLAGFLRTYVNGMDEPRGVWILQAGLFSSLCFLTRYGNAVVMIPMVGVLVWTYARKGKYLSLFFAGLISIGLIYCQWLLKRDYSFAQHNWVSSWSVLNWFKGAFSTGSGYMSYKVINGIYSLFVFIHPGFSLILLPALVFWKRTDFTKLRVTLLVSVIAYLMFVGGIPYQNKRFLLPLVPVLLVLLYPTLTRLIDWFLNRFSFKLLTAVFVTMALFQFVMFLQVLKPIAELSEREKIVGERLNEVDCDRVYCIGLEGAMNLYAPELECISIYNRNDLKMRSKDVLVVSEGRMETQWKGTPTGDFWLSHKSKLVQIGDPIGDWKIYQIQ